ncbi:MAG TPA: nitronate monooxygenase, partial [Pirellulales bacterium]
MSAGPKLPTIGESDSFEIFVASLTGTLDAAMPVAAVRAGGLGLLNLTCAADPDSALRALEELSGMAPARSGLILNAPLGDFERTLLSQDAKWEIVLLHDPGGTTELNSDIAECRRAASRIGVVVSSEEAAFQAINANADFLVAKGHEAGGFVGEETTFVLLQRLLGACSLPLVAWGGIGINTAAACRTAGCAGVLFDWQFALLRESPLSPPVRRRLANADGSESVALAIDPGHYLRFFWQPGSSTKDKLEATVEQALRESKSVVTACRDFVIRQPASINEPNSLRLVGQDIAFAPIWAKQAESVGRALRLLRGSIEQQVTAAREVCAFGEGAPLAQSHGTQFPIVQGPMTRVSDVPEFCEAVAEGGGLPFLALALMGEKQVRELLEATRDRLGDRPWGVGMLGFVPQEIRAQQWPVIEEIRPKYAVIAGGRPDQAASLEARGIATYLHVPSPGMLDVFLQEGARRFVFEGRECGGHVGPRCSFVLWEVMIRVLGDAKLTPEECGKVHVLFAGGIHDALGAAMVATLAQPLVDRGMKVGVLMGTAYLFTEEAVACGAIMPKFQEICLSIDRSVVVESGPGHAIRCANTDFVRLFNEEKQRLANEKWPAEEVRTRLEHLNLGRLRVAAKGVARASGKKGELVTLDAAEQAEQGLYMLGQVAALRGSTCTIRALHEAVCYGAVELLKKLRPSVDAEKHSPPPPRPMDIAIVGMSCLVPGADSPAQLWNNLLKRHDPIGIIPADRFNYEQWYDPDRSARDRICSKWGGFVRDIPFDPLKYGIPPAALKNIEPM